MNAPAKMLTTRVGEATVAVPEELAVLAYLEKMIDGDRAITLSVQGAEPAFVHFQPSRILPAIGADFEGGKFAGLSIFENQPVLLVKLSVQIEEANHKRYKEWCEQQGGVPMTRFDGLVLFTNLRGDFKQEAYWTADDYAGDPAYAWCQSFGGGIQSWLRKGSKRRGVAVRRVSL